MKITAFLRSNVISKIKDEISNLKSSIEWMTENEFENVELMNELIKDYKTKSEKLERSLNYIENLKDDSEIDDETTVEEEKIILNCINNDVLFLEEEL